MDLLMPIFVHVVAIGCVTGKLNNRAVSACEFMKGICPPSQFRGEAGFFITTLDAAIRYLHGADDDESDSGCSTSSSSDSEQT
jgi:hypothetical protein